MEREQIIRMARESGIEFTCDPTETPPGVFVECWIDELERFATLVAEKEREAAEERVTDLFADMESPYLPDTIKAIRARGNT